MAAGRAGLSPRTAGVTPMHDPDLYQRAIDLGPEMELRVRRADGRLDRARVREGLAVGRSAACGLAVDDPAANMIHARVVPGIGGGWELRGVGAARMLL